jgi:hypothetical protein
MMVVVKFCWTFLSCLRFSSKGKSGGGIFISLLTSHSYCNRIWLGSVPPTSKQKYSYSSNAAHCYQPSNTSIHFLLIKVQLGEHKVIMVNNPHSDDMSIWYLLC